MFDEFADEWAIRSKKNPSQPRVYSTNIMWSEDQRAVSPHDSRDGTRDIVDAVQVKNLRVRLPHRLEKARKGGEVIVLARRERLDSEDCEIIIDVLNRW
jgi:hypothetical protein